MNGVICYTYSMNNLHNSHGGIDTFGISDQKPNFTSFFRNKKKLWISIGTGAIIVVLVISLIVLINTPEEFEIVGGGDVANLVYEENDGFSDILNIFVNISDGMTREDLQEILKRAEIDQNYLYINSDEGFGYIAQEEIDPNSNSIEQDTEYISFDYSLADEDYDFDHIDNIVYHSFRNGKHDYIMLTPNYEYTHVYGDYANAFDNVIDAINDYLIREDN